jgi:monofunctional biosynthetic peptidoglycan transglycosylase
LLCIHAALGYNASMRKRKKTLRQRIVFVLGVVIALPYALTLLYWVVPPPSTLMLADWLTLQHVERTWAPLGRISPQLKAAVIVAEDSAFCEHHGFDFTQMSKSLEAAYEYDRPIRGASTITMQTAKNLFLWNGRSWLRKLLEAPLTLWLELMWSKGRILEVYLNVAEWGDGIYGADAAARRYFGVSASELSPRQAALLAAALPDPRSRHTGNPGPGQSLIASHIERRVAAGAADLSCLRR